MLPEEKARYQRIVSFDKRKSLASLIDLARASGTSIKIDEVHDQEDTKHRVKSQSFEFIIADAAGYLAAVYSEVPP